MLYRTLLPTFEGVSADGEATCAMVLGQKVWSITLEIGDDGTSSAVGITGAVAASGLTVAQVNLILDKLIPQIRVRLNAKDQRQMTAVQLNQLNGINGDRYLAICNGTPGQADFRIFLTIYFAEFWRKDNNQVPALAWNLNKKGMLASDGKSSRGDVTDMQVKVQLGSGLNGLSLTGYYLWTPADIDNGIGSICKWESNDFQAVGTKNDFKLDQKQFIQSIHLWPTVENTPRYVTNFRLNASGVDVQDDLTCFENQSYLYQFDLQPDVSATPRFDFVADVDDPVLNALPAATQSSLRMFVKYSGAAQGNIPSIIQRIGSPD